MYCPVCDACMGDVVGADLGEGVTDTGLGALALAGCGSQLTSLTLASEWACVWILF